MTEAEWITFLQRPEIAAFNQAMLANPDDDLPRLVFADWLDENCPDQRICAVIRQSMNGKVNPIPFLPTPADVSLCAERGRLSLTLERDQPPPEDHGCRVLWESGWVGGVIFNNPSPPTVFEWLIHPRMDSVEMLTVFEAGVEVVALVAGADHLTAVRHLNLSLCDFGSDGARTLAASPHLHNLRSLDLSSNPIGDAGLAALAASPLFARLDKLSVGTCVITVAGMRALAASPRFADPRPFELWLAGNQFGDGSPPDTEGLPKTLAAAIINGWEWSLDLR